MFFRAVARLLLCVGCIAPGGAAADVQTAPITLVVPFSPGGVTDMVARVLAERLSEDLQRVVLVENRPGAGGTIAANYVARARPDGLTFLVGTSALAISPQVYREALHDPLRDFAPVSLLATVAHVLIINPTLPVNSLEELIAWLKANPGKANYASVGVGTATHVEAELFKQLVGVEMDQIPYSGSMPALTDLVGGWVDVMFDAWASAAKYAEEGRVRVLAVVAGDMPEGAPELPLLADAVPGYRSAPWIGLLAPAGTPPAVIARYQDAVQRILARPDVHQRLIDMGLQPVGSTAAEFREFLVEDLETWHVLAREAGILAD